MVILNHQSVVPMLPGCYVFPKEYKRNEQDPEHGHIERHLLEEENEKLMKLLALQNHMN